MFASRGAAQIDSTALDLATLSPRLVGLESLPERLALPPRLPDAADPADQWQFEVTPFLWFASLDAKVTVKGNSASASPSFNDIAQDLDYAAMGHLEARKGKWAIFSDLMWLDLGDDNASGPLGVASVDVRIQEFLGSLNLAYQVLDLPLDPGVANGPRLTADAYAGVRYTNYWGQLNFQALNTVSDTLDWWDPLIGVRTQLIVTPKLAFVGRWDFGGWGVGCEHTWFLMGGIEWRGWESVSVGAGYAALYQDYNTSNNSNLEQTTQGPIVSFSLFF